ncbi:MAG TPA: ATP synthase F1 subunit delta [Acidimicrobiales bacterium]|nr:ATP synthase F1 subunit delta [Acidimicrobiales bacterium]
MAEDRVTAYAEALLSVTGAEPTGEAVRDELFRVARALETNDELRTTLADRGIPVARRQQVVDDLLGGPADPVTLACVSLVVVAGHGGDLPAIVDGVVERAARAAGREVAFVRSAIALTADQEARLAAALSAAVEREVEVRVIIDPSVLGGLVTQIGDTVIDGSVRHRLAQLREVF